jgi:hypothetical protein
MVSPDSRRDQIKRPDPPPSHTDVDGQHLVTFDLRSVLISICMVFSCMSVVGSIPVDGGQSRLPRHPFGWNHHDPATHLFN